VDAAEERRSSRHAFRNEAEPEAVRLRVQEDHFDDGSQQCSADVVAGFGDGDALQQRDAFGRGPIPQNGEAGRLVAEQPEEIGVMAVTEC
jgi:hypothetical protein